MKPPKINGGLVRSLTRVARDSIIARQKNLLVCGGSDCHSDNLMNNGGGSVKVPYSVVQEMKRRLANKKEKQA